VCSGFASKGELEIDDLGILTYTYDPLKSNFNARTLQGFSTQAKEKMYECDNCPYPTYDKFYKYYGAFDYANQWVMAAFNKASTNFAKGNANFGIYGMEGTAGMCIVLIGTESCRSLRYLLTNPCPLQRSSRRAPCT
jgi:hypothetical protein